MSTDRIRAAIPHRPPMLLVDEILEESDERIVCQKTFHADEFFVQGHYPDYPIVPGVILCESGMQAGAILLSRLARGNPGDVPVVARLNNVKFRRIVRPGDQVRLDVELVNRFANTFFLKAKVVSHEKTAATFEFACTLTSTDG